MRMNRLSILCLVPCMAALRALAGGSLADPKTATIDANLSPRQGPLPSIAINDPGRVVAKVGDKEITLGMILQPVIDQYGLQQLLTVARREYYRQKAIEEGLTITPADEKVARDRLIEQVFASSLPLDDFKGTTEEKKAARKAEMDKLLPQVLASKNVSVEDFDKALFNQAVLWKIAEKAANAEITEDHLKQVFGYKYGEKVAVRHIQIATLAKAMDVLQRLKKGERFDDIAAKESLDLKSREYGGEIRAFTFEDLNWKPAFREAAFSLKEDNEISDPVNTGEVYEIIQRIKRIPPSIIKFEDVREDVKAELTDLVIRNKVENLRQEYDFKASEQLRISDPGLKERFLRMVDSANKGSSMNEIREQIRRDDAPDQPNASTTGSEVAQPPATKPGK